VFVDTHTQEGRHRRGPKESSPTEQSNTRASHQCLTYVLNACTVCHKEQIRSFHTKIVSFASFAYRIGTSSMRDRHSERFFDVLSCIFLPSSSFLVPQVSFLLLPLLQWPLETTPPWDGVNYKGAPPVCSSSERGSI